jgi:AraC-like DNA-binding protein
MEYLARTPSPPLDAFIERIWYCSDAPTHTRERVLPGGGIDLVINLAEDEIRIYDPANPRSVRAHSGTVFRGTSTRSSLIDPRQRASVIGAHFRPGGAFPFLGISPSEIVDSYVQLDDLWGAAGRNLREQLLEAGSPSERFRLVEAALLWRLRRARPGHPAARAAVDAFRAGGNDLRVADVATLVGLSHRGFIEVFKREVGLTPKLYARLQRFHRAKERIAALGGPPSWATFAIECGYFDQSHMIREFVGFSGISPTSYLRSRTSETMFDHFVHSYATRLAAGTGRSSASGPRGQGAFRPA